MKKLVLTSLLLTGICAAQLGAVESNKIDPQSEFCKLAPVDAQIRVICGQTSKQQTEVAQPTRAKTENDNPLKVYKSPSSVLYLSDAMSAAAPYIVGGALWATVIGGTGYLLHRAGYLGHVLKIAQVLALYTFYKDYPEYSAARLAINDAFDNN